MGENCMTDGWHKISNQMIQDFQMIQAGKVGSFKVLGNFHG